MSAALSRAPSPLLPVPRMLPGHPAPSQRALAERAAREAAAVLRQEEQCLAKARQFAAGGLAWAAARVAACEARVDEARLAVREAEWVLRQVAPPPVPKATGRPMRGWTS